MDDAKLLHAAEAWHQAGLDLGIDIQAPLVIDTRGGPICAVAYIADFGSASGMVLDGATEPSFQGRAEVRQLADERRWYYSIINLAVYEAYEREHFIDTLADWGYYGSHPPEWLPAVG